MRKIKLLKSQSVDILIIDDENFNHVNQCIPEKASFSTLPIRGVIPLIVSSKFLFRVLTHILNSKRIQDAILFSIVDVLQPKILITFTDTSYLMGRIHAEFPEKLTISVQNGFRTGPKYSHGTHSIYPVSLYYGFGEHDGILMKNIGLNNKEYVSAGSLVYGLYKRNQIEVQPNQYDVCFLSQFTTNVDDPHMKVLMGHLDPIFLSLIKACKELNLSLAVAMRYERSAADYLLELNHLKALDIEGYSKIIPNNLAIFEGYNTSTQSNIVVTVHSTLGFEMLGAGRKVLFGASINNFSLAHFWDAFGNFNQLPSMNLLDDFSVDSICSKLNKLIEMDSDDYIEQTKKVREYYMNHFETIPAHELIKTRMVEFLSKTNVV